MLRTDVIQKIIDKKKALSYLEIGVNNGDNFFPIEVAHKVAVDPSFAFSPERKIEWEAKNPCNATAEYITATSDDFFAKAGATSSFDVVFIDGLHTYEQSLQDVLNSVEKLNDNGVIVMHDCKPPHLGAACPAKSLQEAEEMQNHEETKIPEWTGEWCGDVWKTICYLRSYRKDLQVFVLDCDYGLGIVVKGKSDSDFDLSKEALATLDYQEIIQGEYKFLNLKNENYLFEFLDII
jgi:hypothetical protein